MRKNTNPEIQVNNCNEAKRGDVESAGVVKSKNSIQNDLIRGFYSQSLSSAIGDALTVLVLAYLLVEMVYKPYLITWFVFAQSLNLALLGIFVIYKRKKPDDSQFLIWSRMFHVILYLHGIAWGALGLIAYTAADITIFYLSILVIMGLAAASISVLSPIFRLYIVHKILFFTPVIYLTLISATEPVEYAIALFMFFYFVFLIMTGFYHSRSVNEMLTLRHSNAIMLDQLGEEIEERKLAEMQLRQAFHAAESANKAKTQFLANMSHEIRTPLTSVIGFSELLQDPDISKSKRISTANTIVRNGSHLLQIINDILDITKIESEKLDLEKVSISPIKMLQDVEEVFRPSIEAKGIQLDVEYQFPIPEMIETDPVRLKQILFNLVGNAIKFTENGKIVISLCFDEVDKQLLINVTDSGIGLSEEKLESIFNPFDQADSSTTRKFGGSGLGLTISRKLSRMLGGDLTVKSELNIGSIFTLSLGQEIMQTKGWLSSLSQVKSSDSPAEFIEEQVFSGSVLVADDTIDIQELISAYLDDMPLKLTFVDNGEKAVQHALSQEFDLILMDMQMPIMDGLEAAKLLRSKQYRQPIIAVTANTFVEDVEEYNKAGINSFLAKPFNKNDLHVAIGAYLETSAPVVSDEQNKKLRREAIENKLHVAFLKRLPVLLEELSIGIRNKDRELICRKAHTLKGVGGGYGFPQITEMAAAIEKAGEEESFEAAEQYFNELESFYQEYVLNS